MTSLSRIFLLLFGLAVAGCGGGGSGADTTSAGPGDADPVPVPVDCQSADALAELDAALCEQIVALGLTGNPATGLAVPDIESDPLAALGRDLFFTKALSGRGDVACASCHDPRPPFFGSDGLSLPVGVNAMDDDLVGPGRRHNPNDPGADSDPKADAGPNVPRRSLTTFNVVLYEKAMFFDGRVRWLDPGNRSQGMVTPEAPAYQTDATIKASADFPLLQAQARLPVTSQAEMRGFGVLSGEHGAVMRDYLAGRLGGYGDSAGELPSNDWPTRFQSVFGAPDPNSGRMVTWERIGEALAAYQASQLFIDNPWRAYVARGEDVLTEQQKRGALLFLRDRDDPRGGAGCASCHSGDHFTDEDFHILAVPQFGRGKGEGSHADDKGFGISSWSGALDYYKFRTPSLLNVAAARTYGHTGAWTDLEAVIRHHLDVANSLDAYDWTLNSLPQMQPLSVVYEDARSHTEAALNRLLAARVAAALGDILSDDLLHDLSLTDQDVADLAAFLGTLTDDRLARADPADFAPWVASGPDPDGCRLGSRCDLSLSFTAPSGLWPPLAEAPPTAPAVAVDTSAYSDGDGDGVYTRAVPDAALVQKCLVTDGSGGALAGGPLFSEAAMSVGLDYQHAYPAFEETPQNIYGTTYMVAAGVAAADLDDDCYTDLYLPLGEAGSLVLKNTGGIFTAQPASAEAGRGGAIASATLADLDGDGLHDLVVPGFDGEATRILQATAAFDFGNPIQVTEPGTTQSIYSVTAGDYDLNGRLDLFASFWSASSESSQEYLWHNAGNPVANGEFVDFYAATDASGLRGEIVESATFVGNLKDVTNNGWPDLLSVADFGKSQVFHNQGGKFTNVTGDSPITDENGMGTAVYDVNQDGFLDWFVTSIYNETTTDTIKLLSGNRLYVNRGAADPGNFDDGTGEGWAAEVRDGGWGWSACAADFDNDSYQDLFHTNGWGHLRHQGEDPHPFEALLNMEPRLFMLDPGQGSYVEQAVEQGLLPGEGRGVVCADFDRDGDVDVMLVNNGGPVHFYRNNTRALFPERDFLTVRVRNRGPNWEGIGARVHLYTGSGRHYMQDLGGSNYLSQNPVEAHFGLGESASIDRLVVEWPAIGVDGRVYRDRTEVSGASLSLNSIIDVVHPDCNVPLRCPAP